MNESLFLPAILIGGRTGRTRVVSFLVSEEAKKGEDELSPDGGNSMPPSWLQHRPYKEHSSADARSSAEVQELWQGTDAANPCTFRG